MKTGNKSTLSLVTKGLTVAPPQLIGADYGTRGGEFWSINGPGGYDYKFSYTGHTSAVKAFEQCAPLASIIGKKAQAFINGKVFILNKKGKAKEKESTSPVAAKIRNLLSNPNPLQSEKEFRAQQYIYQQLFGYCLMMVNKPVGYPNYEATQLWNLPANMLDIEETKKNWTLAQSNGDVIKSIVIRFGEEKATIPVDQIYIIKDFVPSFNSAVFPESRIKAIEMPVNNIIGAYESRNVLINYRGALGIISSDGKDPGGFLPIKEDEKIALQNDFRRYGLSKSQWQFIITSASIKWTQMGIPTKDLLLFEEIDDDIQRICDQYGYQYELMSSTKGVTFANKEQAKKIFYQDTIIPEAENITEQWERFFDLYKFDLDMEIDFSHVPALQDDQQKMAAARKTRNEALQIEFLHNLITMDDWRIANAQDPIGGEYGGKYYYELLAMGWKFGSTGATPPQQQQQDTNNPDQNQQTNNNQQ